MMIYVFELFVCELFDVMFCVICSKGMYVCMLVEDIGEVLGCGVYLMMLCCMGVGVLMFEYVVMFDVLLDVVEVVCDVWL